MHTSLASAVELVQALVDNTSSVIYVKDVAGRYLLINRQFELLFAVRREDVLGKTDHELFPEPWAELFRRNDELVVQTGQLLECEEVAPLNDGAHVYLSVKFPLRDATGSIYALGGVSTDITERLRAAEEMESLRHRTELLLESVGDGICGINRQGLIDFANSAAVRLLDWPVEQLLGQPYLMLWPQLHEAANSDPVAVILNGCIQQRVERTSLLRRDGSRLPVECLANPVLDHGRVTGVVLAFRDLRERLARQRTDQELEAAYQIQRFLYPRQPPCIPGFDVAGMTFPSQHVCGDYYDFQPWDAPAWCLTLGDVSGHGLGPALHMVETRALLRSVLRETNDPAQVLYLMNQSLSEDLPDGMFVTLFVARLEPTTRTLTYASAGHPAGVLRQDGSILRLTTGGFPLGLIPEVTYASSASLRLQPHDILIVASDGLSEMRTRHQELFGWQRLWAVVNAQRDDSAQEIGHALFHAARQFAQDEPQHDDVTIIVARCLADSHS